MNNHATRDLPVQGGTVQCTTKKREVVEKCRFCVHSTKVMVRGRWLPSPARAFCTFTRAVGEVRLGDVTCVRCDDDGNEGFRSILNVIS